MADIHTTSPRRFGFVFRLLVLATLCGTLGCSPDRSGDHGSTPDAGPDSADGAPDAPDATDSERSYTFASVDGVFQAPFGALPYRLYYPEDFDGQTYLVHVSRGGPGLGDDRGQLLPYVEGYVERGFVVLQLDHRFAGRDIETIAQFRGQEIDFAAQQVVADALELGDFQGTIDASRQGFAGHSGGCMEGLEAAGTAMTHGDYTAPQIRAVYCMSPAGFRPDQFGIRQDPPGYVAIGNAAVFLVVGEEEKDTNGPETLEEPDWRLQAYDAMSEDGPRFEAIVRGPNTAHLDVKGENPDIEAYNLANSLELFNVYLAGQGDEGRIGELALPASNPVDLSTKGLP